MKLARAVIAAGALLVLGVVNYSIFGKERVIRHGASIYLELAPVDPRSLMQGDYMALRFRVADDIKAARESGELPRDTRIARLRVAENGIATLVADAAPDTIPLRFRVRSRRIWLGTDAYFFSEGAAERFARAAYGEFRIDVASGEAVLIGLRTAALEAL
jgi:uncharacterized membrane-anchored protein